MLLIIENGKILSPEWKDHPLAGSWQGHRDCRVGGDFLLIYLNGVVTNKDEKLAFEWYRR